MPRLLGIETSCDETSAAVLSGDGDRAIVESCVILSQDVHRVFGGVVPELASRAHLTALVPVVDRALADAGVGLEAVEAVAVTSAPGLVGALLVGVTYAKALAAARGIPLVGVHHLEGHLFATSLEHPDAVPPFTALLVSGGHTLLVDVAAWGAYRVLGRTRDDAAGEAFDKVGKLLGLPYPGGPHVERLAAEGAAADAGLQFTPPMLHGGQRPDDADYYDVSFSGLKTAVRNALAAAPSAAAVARAFQDALVEALVEKTARAVRAHRRTRVVLGGGVAANRTLVDRLARRLAPDGVRVYAPGVRLATDNAAMIARVGLFRLQRGERAGFDLTAHAVRPLPGLVA